MLTGTDECLLYSKPLWKMLKKHRLNSPFTWEGGTTDPVQILNAIKNAYCLIIFLGS